MGCLYNEGLGNFVATTLTIRVLEEQELVTLLSPFYQLHFTRSVFGKTALLLLPAVITSVHALLIEWKDLKAGPAGEQYSVGLYSGENIVATANNDID